MRVRLSLSKLGWLACRKHLTVDARLDSLGGPVRLRSHSTDISVVRELLLSGGYAAIPRHAGQPVKTIVDLGANTGLATRWLVRHYPGARVVCVEPEASNARLLRHNVATLEQNAAVVVEACVGSRERRVVLRSQTGAWGYSMVDVQEIRTDGDAEVLTMERILREAGVDDVDVLKCDIEGAEREVFDSCEPWIQRVRLAVVECHRDLDGEGLLELIERNGGRFELVDRLPDPTRGYETVALRNKMLSTGE